MSAGKYPAMVAALVIGALSVGLAWFWRTEGTRNSIAAAALAQRTRALQGEVLDLEGESARWRSAVQRVEAEFITWKESIAQAADLRPKATAIRTLSTVDTIRHEPDAQVLFLANQKAALNVTYGLLFRQLALTNSEIQHFLATMVEQQESSMDLSDMQRHGTADPATIATLQREADTRRDSALRELLGEKGYRTMKDYDRTSQIRTLVSAIAGLAVVENVAFTPAQTDGLVQAIIHASDDYRQGGTALLQEPGMNWDYVDAKARGLLSPDRYELLSTMDPGPTRGGMLQARLYSLFNRVNREEKNRAR